MGFTKHGQGEVLREEDDTRRTASQQERERLMAEVRAEGQKDEEAED